jgi:hypothetical protein
MEVRPVMLRLIPLAILIALSVPSQAAEVASGDVVAQQQQQTPQQAPKRDCEKKQDEGVSA